MKAPDLPTYVAQERTGALGNVPSSMLPALLGIVEERMRQKELKASGRFAWLLEDAVRVPTWGEHNIDNEPPGRPRAISNSERLAVLAEEFGEVSQLVVTEQSQPIELRDLRDELLQVAACCVAWVEFIDRKTGVIP